MAARIKEVSSTRNWDEFWHEAVTYINLKCTNQTLLEGDHKKKIKKFLSNEEKVLYLDTFEIEDN